MLWKTEHPHPILNLRSFIQGEITRQGFADVLQSIGTNIEASLQTVERPAPSSGYPQKLRNVPYDIWIDIYDWEAKREWWLYHLINCFPTWMLQRQLKMVFRTRKSYPVIRQSPNAILISVAQQLVYQVNGPTGRTLCSEMLFFSYGPR